MIYTLIKRDNNDNIEAVMSFDSVTSFDESWSASVTTQPVEKGFNISDNITIEPQSYDIQAILTGYSLFDTNREVVWDGESFKSNSPSDKTEHIKAKEKLVKLFTDRSILSVLETSQNSNSSDLTSQMSELTSGYNNEINNCVITSLSISHPDASTGAFFVNIKLQKIYVALVTTVQVGEGQMQPALIPFKKEVSKTGSTSTDGSVADSDLGSAAIMEGDLPNMEETAPLTGRTQAQFERYKAAREAPIRGRIAAVNKAKEIAAATGRGVDVESVSGGNQIVYR